MVIRYRCKCGYEFDGHWHRAGERRRQFPQYGYMPDHVITQICPVCGNKDGKVNTGSDEDLSPERTGSEPAGVDEEDMTP